MFKLGVIFEAALLLINAIAILNEDRFLARIGWVSPSRQLREGNAYQQTYDQNGYGGGQAELGIKARLIDLISAVRTLMRIPLIAINTLVILYELVIP